MVRCRRLPVLLCAGIVLAQLGAAQQRPGGDRFAEPTLLRLKTLTWDTSGEQPGLAAGWSLGPEQAAEAGYWIVQAAPERLAEARTRVRDRGGRVFDYLPHNAFAAWLPAGAEGPLGAEVQAVVPVHPALKVDPALGAYGTARDQEGRHLVAVELWPDRELAQELDELLALGVEVLESHDSGRYLRALARADDGQVLALARLPGVQWIEESSPAALRNEKSRWVIQTNVPKDVKLWQRGVTGRGVVVGHIDDPLWEDSCYFDDPSGVPPGPSHRKVLWSSMTPGASSHGTHTAGSAVGYSAPVSGSIGRSGMAPEAYLVHHGFLPNSSNLLAMLNEANSHGARIHTNSWGNDATRDYNLWCRDIDAYSHDNEDALVLFAVSNGINIKNPENAKSAVAVAATRRDDPSQHGSGGKGPTEDGRLKPEVLAPGCATFSAAVGAACSTVPMCGTSMACPVVAGAAALLKQYFQDGYWPSGAPDPASAFVPSGALLRACLANSAVDMTGLPGYPSYEEGWGRILLDNVAYFQGDVRRLEVFDVRHASGLLQGQVQTYSISVQGGSKLRVTMAFADEPAGLFASDPVVNDLDLVVRAPDGTTYHGNVLRTDAGGVSRPNPGKHDPRNSLETVTVAVPQSGTWTVEVVGRSVPVGPQGYAVVAAF